MKTNLLFLLLLFSIKLYSQNSISGNVISDSQVELSGVLIVNMNSQEQTFSDKNGHFIIHAKENEELRFIRQNYERVSFKIKSENFREAIKVQMNYKPQEIEEVEIKYKVTGDLKEDSKHFGASKKDIALNIDLGKDRQELSSLGVLKPKVGEFVQPKVPGFETTKIGYKWEKLDLQIYLEEILTRAYFNSIGLQNSEILPFIGFTLKYLDTENMLRFGRVNSGDLARFQIEAERRLEAYKKSSL